MKQMTVKEHAGQAALHLCPWLGKPDLWDGLFARRDQLPANAYHQALLLIVMRSADMLLKETARCESYLESVWRVYQVARAYQYLRNHSEMIPINVWPQVTLRKVGMEKERRIDFLYEWRRPIQDLFLAFGQNPPLVAVETDGYEHHHANRAQVVEDDRRNRQLALSGILPIHYSYDEVMAGPQQCVDDAYKFAFRVCEERANDIIRSRLVS